MRFKSRAKVGLKRAVFQLGESVGVVCYWQIIVFVLYVLI